MSDVIPAKAGVCSSSRGAGKSFSEFSCCIYATFEESSVSCCCFTLQIDLFPMPDYETASETVDSTPGTAESYRNLQGKIITGFV
jgi:hypothetical protein